MDVNVILKGVKNLNQYIFVKDKIVNMKPDIILNMRTILYLKNLRSLEIEYYKKYKENGAAFIIFEHLLHHPPSDTWDRLGREMISLLHYWLDGLRKHFSHDTNWWSFLEFLLKFIKAIILKHTCLPDILVEEIGECLLDLSTNNQLDINQKQEVLRCLNLCSRMCSIDTKIKTKDQFGNYFTQLCIEIAECGHFPTQFYIMETLLHWLPHCQELEERKIGAKWFPKNLFHPDVIAVFLEKTWSDVFQDARCFLNIHNERNDLIVSEVCKSISIGSAVLNFASEKICWLDINLKTKSISVLLKPDMLKNLGNINITDETIYLTFIISAENITSARLYRDFTSITLSMTTSCIQHLEPAIKDAFKDGEHNVKVIMPTDRLARIDKALIEIFGNKYQLRKKLYVLPRHNFQTEIDAMDETHHKLSSITERNEHTFEERSDIAVKCNVFQRESKSCGKSFKCDNNFSISPKTKEYPLVNTDVNIDHIDPFAHVTLRDKTKHKKFENSDNKIIDYTPIMKPGINRSISNKNIFSKSKTPSIVSHRSRNLNQVFDELLKETESNEKIHLMDNANQVYNFTSDSEDEDFKENTMKLRSGLNVSRGGIPEFTKHGKVNNRVNFSETQLDSSKDKIIKTARRRPGKKCVKPETGVKQSKCNTVRRNEMLDEVMRTASSKVMDTSLNITTRRRTIKKEPEPLTKEYRMEPIVYDLTNDKHVETNLISENKQPKKKTRRGKPLSFKNEKVVNKITSSRVIKNNADDKSASPLPELVVEPVISRKNHSDDFVSVEKVKALRKMYDDFEYDNVEDTTQNLPSDISKLNNTCDTINKPLVIDVDKQNIIESHHTIEEKQKEATQCKISKISVPNIEDDLEIMSLSESNLHLDKSMIINDNCSENAFLHSHLHSNRKPPSIALLEERIEPRDLELIDLVSSTKEYYLKMRKKLYNTSNTHESLVKDNEEQLNDGRKRRKGVRRLSGIFEKLSLFENFSFEDNKKMVANKNDDNKESFTISSHQSEHKHDDAMRKQSLSKELMDKNINKSAHKSLISPINFPDEMLKPSTSQQFLYGSIDVQEDANISNLNSGKKTYSVRKGSSVRNAASDELNNSAKYDIPKLARKRTLNYDEILDCRTATEASGHKIRKSDDKTASNSANTIYPPSNSLFEDNTKTTAETPEKNTNIEEDIIACLEKLETAVVAFDERTSKTIMQTLSLVPKQIREAQEKKLNLMRDFEEKFKEIEKQTQEETVKFLCDVVYKDAINKRKLFLSQMKDLNALYRLISKKK